MAIFSLCLFTKLLKHIFHLKSATWGWFGPEIWPPNHDWSKWDFPIDKWDDLWDFPLYTTTWDFPEMGFSMTKKTILVGFPGKTMTSRDSELQHSAPGGSPSAGFSSTYSWRAAWKSVETPNGNATKKGMEKHQIWWMSWMSCTSWKRCFFPLFISFQPSFWWCRISQPSTVWKRHKP